MSRPPRIAPIPIHCAHAKVLPISRLVEQLHPSNPNTHPPEQLRLYAKIIRAQGWRRAVVISKRTGHIVSGNGAVLASQAHGIESAPVEYQAFKTAAAELAHLNADNELARLSAQDDRKLAALVDGLGDTDRELAAILEELSEPIQLKPVTIQDPPALGWCLIALPLKDWGKLTPHLETLARITGLEMETTVTDDKR